MTAIQDARHVARAGRAGTARRLLIMKRILLTGMSGTGKSSVIRALADLGYKAIGTDDGWCEQLPDGRQRWREDAITALLAIEETEMLLLAGCEENQVQFHPQFDHIILLSAPIKTMLQRLGARASNPYGQAPGDLDRVVSDTQNIEPLLRQAADHEISTTMPLHDVVTGILRLASE